MDIEKDYIEYVAVFSLSILAVSAAYFLDPGKPVTYLTLLVIPLLFGYTAYISRNGFKRASLLSLSTLFFLILGSLVSAVALVVAVGNTLVSAFAGGEYFRDYFSSTSIPLLLTGLVLGSAVFLAASSQPELKDQVRSSAGEVVGDQTERLVEQSQIFEKKKEKEIELMKRTSETAVKATKVYVFNETRKEVSLDAQEYQAVNDAFTEAERKVPETVENRTRQKLGNYTLDISARTSAVIEKNFKGEMFLALIPATALIFYSLQPLVGLLTALFASVFAYVSED